MRQHRVFACLFLVTYLGGCSYGIPLPSLLGNDDATASLASPRPKPARDSPENFDSRDWKEARGALVLALAPQSAGQSIDWANPATGGQGSFTALAGEFPQNARMCRAFVADVGAGTKQKTLEGLACKDALGEWAVDLSGGHGGLQ